MTFEDDGEEEADVHGLEILEEVEVFRPDQIGFHPAVLLSSLFKRIVEAHAGRGGVEALCEYLDKIDWVEGLSDLGQITKCTKFLNFFQKKFFYKKLAKKQA